MRMKNDHMRNYLLKPGYNVQIGVESEYIIGVDVSDKSLYSGKRNITYGVLKGDYGFRRFLMRGKESFFCCLLRYTININKLHNRIQSNRCGMSYTKK